jgi:hypothetical protein
MRKFWHLFCIAISLCFVKSISLPAAELDEIFDFHCGARDRALIELVDGGCKRPKQGPPGPAGPPGPRGPTGPTGPTGNVPPTYGLFLTHATAAGDIGAHVVNNLLPVLFNQNIPFDTAPPGPLVGIMTNAAAVPDPSGKPGIVGYTDIKVPVTGDYLVTWGVSTRTGGQFCLARLVLGVPPPVPLIIAQIDTGAGNQMSTDASIISLTGTDVVQLINNSVGGANADLQAGVGTGSQNVTAFVTIELLQQTGP